MKSVVKIPKSPCEQSLLARVNFADDGVRDEVLSVDAENSVQAEVIENLEFVKATSSQWPRLTAVEKDRPDQRLVDPNTQIDVTGFQIGKGHK